MDLALHLELVAPADGERGGGPLADAVQRQDRGLVEGRGVEGAGRVAQVVLAEQQPLEPGRLGIDLLQFPDQQVLQEQLLAQPDRHGDPE